MTLFILGVLVGFAIGELGHWVSETYSIAIQVEEGPFGDE